MKIVVLFFLLVLGFSEVLLAQGCGAGIPSAGNPGCIPPDRSNSPYYQRDMDATSSPREVWVDRWGAIAFGRTSILGVSEGKVSKRDAEDAALEDCTAQGGRNCKVDLSYYNQCAAVAWGASGSASVGAATVERASENSMKVCRQRTVDCQIFYSACSLAERVK